MRPSGWARCWPPGGKLALGAFPAAPRDLGPDPFRRRISANGGGVVAHAEAVERDRRAAPGGTAVRGAPDETRVELQLPFSSRVHRARSPEAVRGQGASLDDGYADHTGHR